MHRLRREFSIKDLCRVLRVGRSTYYKHFNGKESPRTVENRTIMGFMLRLYGSHSKRIGVHKTKHLLEREYGIRISIGRVYRLMKRMDLPRPSTSKPKASKSKADDKGECLDRVNRNFSVDEPDRIWCSDFTYIWTDEGWAFLCVVIDLFSRKVVSWSLMKRHTCALVCEAFRKAFWRRGAPRGLTFHSDRGSEYSSSEFRRLLDSCSVVQSFSAPGCPYDNSVCESFFKYLKKEETDRYRYRTFEQLSVSILGYIDGYYNSRRLHSSIGYMTPNEKDASFYRKG